MRTQRLFACLAVAAAALSVAAQARAQSGSIPVGSLKHRWLGQASLGLSIHRNDFRIPCTSGVACEELSVVGRASFGDSSLGVFGKVGSTQQRSLAPGFDSGYGLSYGAGISWDFSPRASATLGVDSYDLRIGSGPVRATNLGLQWRY